MITAETNVLRTARTMLFVPGDRPDRFAGAARSEADVVVIDLEDAVAPAAKAAARIATTSWLAAGGSAVVRLNAAGTGEHELDLEALAEPVGLLGVMLAKSEDASALHRVHAATGVRVIALIETARGMAGIRDVASCSAVDRLAFGSLDYAADLGCSPDRDAMYAARSTLVLASRVAGLPSPVDGVTTDLANTIGLADDVAHARSLGFTGKLVIHPRQIAPVHEAFAPGDDELEWARRVTDAAAGTPSGVVQVDGQMVDAPVLARALGILHHAGGSRSAAALG